MIKLFNSFAPDPELYAPIALADQCNKIHHADVAR